MKRLYKYTEASGIAILLLWMLGNISTSIYAQQITQKEFEKLIRDADYLYDSRQTADAAKKYEEIVKIDPQNYACWYKLGRCYWYIDNMEKSIIAYRKALEIKPDANDTLIFDLAESLKKNYNCEEAIIEFNRFIEKHKKEDALTRQARKEIQGCELYQYLEKQPDEFRIINLELINSKAGDFDPNLFIVKGDSFLIFTSHREGSRGKLTFKETGEKMADAWVIRMTSDTTFAKPKLSAKELKKKAKAGDTGNAENLGRNINTKANDGAACIAPDGKTMYYTICGKGKSRKFYGCSIYKSEFNTETKSWSPFMPVEGINGTREVVINTKGKKKKVPTFDAQPCLSPDGNTMYFVSDRDGGQGETDIWFSKKVGDAWTEPVNCGKAINTEFNEIYPEINPDGRGITFASDGHVGLGGYDIFRAEGKENNWTNPVNLGKPLNSSADDFSLIWLKQDSLGFFASSRAGGLGREDIYGFAKIPKRIIEVSVHGLVRDLKSRQAIPFATVSLFRIRDDGSIEALDTFKTDQSGSYKFSLEPGFNYKLVGNAADYLANEVKVSTKKDFTESVDLEADIDIFLDRIEVDKPIILQNIYYDFDSSALRKEAMIELDKLVRILQDNPHITIQLGSHTDTNGSESYNIALSERRAKSVVDYLVNKGNIAKDRLSWTGFGESQPLVYPELSDKDEQMNRRTEFRIQSTNYQPKNK